MVLDIVFLLLVVAGVAFGLWKGLLTQVLLIVGLYLGALVARFVYQPVGQSIVAVVGLDLRLTELIIFLFVLVLVPVLLIVGAHSFWGSLRLPYSLGQLDLLGGALVGLLGGMLAGVFLVLLFGYLASLSQYSPDAVHYPLYSQIQATWTSSIVRPLVVHQFGHFVYYSLLPKITADVPDILQVFAP
jgi:uncharacterized membrane protein required for colicin V production